MNDEDRNFDDRVRRLVHAAVSDAPDSTSPVAADHLQPVVRARHRRFAAVAAALICVLGVGGLVAIMLARDSADSVVASFDITDDRAINLDDAIVISEQRRLAEVGPLLSFDFTNLSAGWAATTRFTTTTGSGFGPAEYWQQVAVSSPDGVDLVVNVEGSLDGEDVPMLPVTEGATVVEVRGQEAQLTDSSLTWIEDGRAQVSIVRGPSAGLTDISSEMVKLAGLLQSITEDLDWSGEPRRGQQFPDAETLLAGELAGTPWRILETSNGLVLATGTDATVISSGSTSPGTADEIVFSIEPVSTPGGVVIHGDAPDSIDSVILRTENSSITLPVTKFGKERIAFAVPVDDRLDPLAIDFIGTDGQQLASIPREDLPPYFGGVTSSSITVDGVTLEPS